MQLNYKEFGAGQPMVILHGLYGSSDNWQTHGKKLAKYFHVFILDLRNHGLSGWSNTHTYKSMAADVYEFITEHQLRDVILMGHSMGAKVAIEYAVAYPETLKHLIAVDMGIKAYPYPKEHERRIRGLEAINLSTLTSRREANEQLAQYEEHNTIRMFLLKNLYRKTQNQWAWHFNLPVLAKSLNEIVSVSPRKETKINTLFIHGGKSDRVLPSDYSDIQKVFPLVQFYKIPSADHWIHAEAPEEFLKAILDFLT